MTEVAPLPEHRLSCSVDRDGSQAHIRLGGRLDLDTVWRLGAELSALIRAGHKHLTVDLSECADISPVCVGVINRAVAELKAAKGMLALRGVSKSVLRRLYGAGLHPAVRTSTRHLDVVHDR